MSKSDQSFQLGPWIVAQDRMEIVGPDGARHLEPKAMEMLVYLARNAEKTVSRDELIEKVWPAKLGSDETLSRIISILRAALDDDARNPRFIETVPKLGYRLKVRPAPIASAGACRPGIGLKARVAAAGLVVVAVAALALLLPGLSETDPGYTVAVLPFNDLGENPGREYFTVGLSDEIIYTLSRSPFLNVVARRSLANLRPETTMSDVDFYIEGTVGFGDGRVRVFAELVASAEGVVVWSDAIEARDSDYQAIQRELSRRIVSAMNEELDVDIRGAYREEVSMAAYTQFLNGQFLAKLRGNEPLQASIAAFSAALEMEPDFDAARLGLANSWVLTPYYSDQNEAEAFEIANQQLASLRQPDSAEADAIRAFIAFREWRWADADLYFRQSLDKQANIANTYVWYSQFLSAVGRREEALEAARTAYELDPVSPVVNDRLAVAHLWLDQDQQARQYFAASASLGFVNQRNPGFLILLVRGQELPVLQQALRLLHPGEAIEPLVQNIDGLYDPSRREALIVIADEMIDRQVLLPRLEMGLWIVLGEWERAVDSVTKYLDDRRNLDVEYLFAREALGLRENPSFAKVARDMGLDAFWQTSGGGPL